MTESEYKNCPYCDNEIKQLALKCKHCKKFLYGGIIMSKLKKTGIGGIVAGLIIAVIAGIIIHCFTTQPEFTISVDPMRGEVVQGGTISTTINVRSESVCFGLKRYAENISLSYGVERPNIRVSFVPIMGVTKPAFTSNVNISVDSNVPPGRYAISILGMGADGTEKICTYTLIVIPNGPNNNNYYSDIKLTINADPETYSAVGENISYSYTVENTGNLLLKNVTVSDENFEEEIGTKTRLEPNESVEFTYIYSITIDDIEEGAVSNNAKVIAKDPTGEQVTDTDSEKVDYEEITKIEITDPLDNDTVERKEVLQGESENIPEGQNIWIVVFPHSVGRYYPMEEPAKIRIDGNWFSTVYIGVEDDEGEKFDIYAVLADNKTFKEYFKGEHGGLQILPESAKKYDYITVTRE